MPKDSGTTKTLYRAMAWIRAEADEFGCWADEGYKRSEWRDDPKHARSSAETFRREEAWDDIYIEQQTVTYSVPERFDA